MRAKYWTKQQEIKLADLWMRGLSGSQCGKALKRSRGSVLGKLSRMGLLGKDSQRPEQDKSLLKQIDFMREHGFTNEEVATELGISVKTIYNMRSRVSD